MSVHCTVYIEKCIQSQQFSPLSVHMILHDYIQGFIGGGFATVLMTLGISYWLCHYPYFVCPIEYSSELERMTMSCEPSALFRWGDQQSCRKPGMLKFQQDEIFADNFVIIANNLYIFAEIFIYICKPIFPKCWYSFSFCRVYKKYL